MVEEVYGDAVIQHPKYGPVKTAAEYIYGDTDSVFMTFHLTRAETGEKIRGDAAMELTIEFSKHVAQLCTDGLEKPMELSYEKTFKVMALLSKKRYAGLICEDNIHKTKLKFMGLPLKRRDNCDYLKDVYGGVLDCLLYSIKPDETGQEKVSRACHFLQGALDDLLEGRVPMEKLAITKALRDYYKNPASIAHSVLAERIGLRDPGNKPKPGDRLCYLFIENKDSKALQGDCIETPEYIIANKLQLNYAYYVSNQIMKPLIQLLGLAIEDIMLSLNKLADLRHFQTEWKTLQKDCSCIDEMMKWREKTAAKWVKLYLFDPVLNKLSNNKKGMRSLKDIWSKK
jgi:DNA polymerase elongation subunit (family B)